MVSLSGLGLGVAADIGLITVRPKRKLATFTSQVTFNEEHHDTLTITRHPVEQGATITDHAYKEPAKLVVSIGFSQSSIGGLISAAGSAINSLTSGDVKGALGGFFGTDYVKEMYQKFLDLQNSREPFEVVTGKRKYSNMLIASLSTTTDATTENVLLLTVDMQEIIIVETQAAALPPAEDQAKPEQTAAPENAGTKQLTPAPQVNQSALSTLAGIGG